MATAWNIIISRVLHLSAHLLKEVRFQGLQILYHSIDSSKYHHQMHSRHMHSTGVPLRTGSYTKPRHLSCRRRRAVEGRDLLEIVEGAWQHSYWDTVQSTLKEDKKGKHNSTSYV